MKDYEAENNIHNATKCDCGCLEDKKYVTKCVECDETLCKLCKYICNGCQGSLCGTCGTDCHECDSPTCYECSNYIGYNDIHFCMHC